MAALEGSGADRVSVHRWDIALAACTVACLNVLTTAVEIRGLSRLNLTTSASPPIGTTDDWAEWRADIRIVSTDISDVVNRLRARTESALANVPETRIRIDVIATLIGVATVFVAVMPRAAAYLVGPAFRREPWAR